MEFHCGCDFTWIYCVASNPCDIVTFSNNDGSDGILGLVTVLSTIAHAETDLLIHVLIRFLNMEWMRNEGRFFFAHSSKIFNVVFLDLPSSWWRGQWYPWIRHGPLFDRYYEVTWLCWVIWTSKERKGSPRRCPLSLPPTPKWETVLLDPARGASHDMQLVEML